MIYDTIIIGGGPAGSAAAVYAARKQLKSLIIAEEFGGQSSVSEEIYNWIGTPAISGTDLAKSFETHVREYEGDYLQIITGQRVTKVSKNDETFTVTTNKDESFETKTVVVTSGSGRRKLQVPGAEKFENKGVVYCASCDGPLFSGMDVVVIGGGNAGFETAAQLAAYCKSVAILHHRDAFKADQITVDKVLARDNMIGILNAETKQIDGDAMVSSLTYIDKTTGEDKVLNVQGVFVEIGQIPNTDFVDGVVALDQYKRIEIDFKNQRTSVPGIWAAGDATNVLYHQNNISAGDAVKAIEDVYLYLHT